MSGSYGGLLPPGYSWGTLGVEYSGIVTLFVICAIAFIAFLAISGVGMPWKLFRLALLMVRHWKLTVLLFVVLMAVFVVSGVISIPPPGYVLSVIQTGRP